MDEVGAHIQQQSSVNSETNSEELSRFECKCEDFHAFEELRLICYILNNFNTSAS